MKQKVILQIQTFVCCLIDISFECFLIFYEDLYPLDACLSKSQQFKCPKCGGLVQGC